MHELILGGARSGKSALAEHRALAAGRDVVYIATAQALDAEMAMRIDHHRARRPAHWRCIEEPLALAEVLRAEAGEQRCLLVDCLTLWLGNLLGHEDASRFGRERDALLAVLPTLIGILGVAAFGIGVAIYGF